MNEAILGKYAFDVAGKQQRLAGRVRAVRDLDLSPYKIGAKVDKVILKVRLGQGKGTAAGTNFRSVQDELKRLDFGKLYVRPTTADPDEKRSWLDFYITFQDPSLPTLLAASEALESAFGLRERPILIEIEVALDMRPQSADGALEARLAAVEMLRLHFLPSREYGPLNPRAYNPQTGRMFTTKNGQNLPWYVDHTWYFGNMDAPVFWKSYHKEWDRITDTDGDKDRVALPELDKSARLEATFTEQGVRELLGLTTLDDLKENGLRGLKCYFPFFAPTVMDWGNEETELMKLVKRTRARLMLQEKFEEQGIWSVWDKTEYRGARRVRSNFVSHGDLNRRVSIALQNLNRQWTRH